MELTAERVRELLVYEPETGEFRNRIKRNGRAMPGQIAGSPGSCGRKKIKIDGTFYRTYRLAWLWMTGEWPEDEIDHIDGDPANDRWSNLRQATRSQNLQNARIGQRNTSGFKGVSPRKNRWMAQITLHGTAHYLGCFAAPEEAYAAYVAAAERLFGEFARLPAK